VVLIAFFFVICINLSGGKLCHAQIHRQIIRSIAAAECAPRRNAIVIIHWIIHSFKLWNGPPTAQRPRSHARVHTVFAADVPASCAAALGGSKCTF
jgi:hypothetical protein